MERALVEKVGGIEVDTRYLPIIVIRYYDAFVGKDFLAMTERLVDAAAPRRWLGMLHDTTALTRVVDAAERKHIREGIARASGIMDEKGISAVVISNPIVRGAMTAAKWFASSRFEEKIFGTEAAGIDWLIERLRSKGVAMDDVANRILARPR